MQILLSNFGTWVALCQVSQAMSFLFKWKADIWPVVQKKYDVLLQHHPAKQDSAIGTHYEVKKMYEILMSKKEVHNVTCNLTWTEPVENTVLQSNISMVTVERFTLDMYVDMTAVASAVKVAGSAASVAGSAAAESAVAGSAAKSSGDNVGEGEGREHTAQVFLQSSRTAWKIP